MICLPISTSSSCERWLLVGCLVRPTTGRALRLRGFIRLMALAITAFPATRALTAAYEAACSVWFSHLTLTSVSRERHACIARERACMQCRQPDTPAPHLTQRLEHRCCTADALAKRLDWAQAYGASQRLTGQERPQAEVVAQGCTRRAGGSSTMSIAKLHTSPPQWSPHIHIHILAKLRSSS
jgi:hypothetical protein